MKARVNSCSWDKIGLYLVQPPGGSVAVRGQGARQFAGGLLSQLYRITRLRFLVS